LALNAYIWKIPYTSLPPSLAENNLQNKTPIVALRHDGVFLVTSAVNTSPYMIYMINHH